MIELVYKIRATERTPYKNFHFKKYFKTWDKCYEFVNIRRLKSYETKEVDREWERRGYEEHE
jgi:hypothetical protein